MRLRRSGVVLAAVAAALLFTVTASSASAADLVTLEGYTLTDPAPGGDGDGILEPRETAKLTVRLRNRGAAPITGLAATLSANASDVPLSTATWPTIAPGTTRAGTSFEVSELGYECGKELGFSLDVTSDQGTDREQFSIHLGEGPEIASRDPGFPRLIYLSDVESTLEISDPGTVKNLRVRFPELYHQWTGDLAMTLTSPRGTRVLLMYRPGPRSFGFQGHGFRDLTLADDASRPIDSADKLTDYSWEVGGDYRPEEPLSVFDGENQVGTWTLRIADLYKDTFGGELTGWKITPAAEGSCSTPGNDYPVARDDAYTADAGAAMSGTSVLANDTDVDGDALSVWSSTSPSHGDLAWSDDGHFTYTADANYLGTDTFEYWLYDGNTTNRGKATITVTGPNQPPVAYDQKWDIAAGATMRNYLVDPRADPNRDPLTVTLTGGGLKAGKLNLLPDGAYAYTAPEFGVTFMDSFEYSITDGRSEPSIATFRVQVWTQTGLPAPPAPPAAPKKASPRPESRAFANFRVQRAAFSGAKLKVRAAISKLATGKVKATFRSGGRTASAQATITGGTVTFALPLSARQRRSKTGVLKLAYAGNTLTRPERIRLAAARRSPGLRSTRAHVSTKGMLRVAGTIRRGVRGIVRVHLTYSPRVDTTKVYDYKAKIRGGKWSVTDALPDEALRVPSQVTISYAGDPSRGIGGALLSEDVGR